MLLTHQPPDRKRRGHGRRLEAGGEGGALSAVRRGGEGAQPPGLRTPRLRSIRLQVEDAHLLLTGGRRERRGGGEAVGCEEEGRKTGRRKKRRRRGGLINIQELIGGRLLQDKLSYCTHL